MQSGWENFVIQSEIATNEVLSKSSVENSTTLDGQGPADTQHDYSGENRIVKS